MNYRQILLQVTMFIYTYFFLSSWDVPTTETIVMDPKAIERWIERTNLRINIYWNEFKFLLNLFKLYLNLKKYN